MHPKEEGKKSLPDFSSIYEHDLDAAILSHAHLDHSGSMPIVQRHYPEMPVMMTEATSTLSQALLHNSVNVMTSKRNELGLDEYPFFITEKSIKSANVGTTEEQKKNLN